MRSACQRNPFTVVQTAFPFAPNPSSQAMGRLCLQWYDGERTYVCKYCETHISSELDKNWDCTNPGPGKNFRHVINVDFAKEYTQNNLDHGEIRIRNLFCRSCQKYLGFAYVGIQEGRTFRRAQEYGTFLLFDCYLKIMDHPE